MASQTTRTAQPFLRNARGLRLEYPSVLCANDRSGRQQLQQEIDHIATQIDMDIATGANRSRKCGELIAGEF